MNGSQSKSSKPSCVACDSDWGSEPKTLMKSLLFSSFVSCLSCLLLFLVMMGGIGGIPGPREETNPDDRRTGLRIRSPHDLYRRAATADRGRSVLRPPKSRIPLNWIHRCTQFLLCSVFIPPPLTDVIQATRESSGSETRKVWKFSWNDSLSKSSASDAPIDFFFFSSHTRLIRLVSCFCPQFLSAGRVMVVGNGGIALELVHSLAHLEHLRTSSSEEGSKINEREIIWAIKDRHLGNTFLDEAASAFVFPFLFPDRDPDIDPKIFQSKGSIRAGPPGQPRFHSLQGVLFPFVADFSPMRWIQRSSTIIQMARVDQIQMQQQQRQQRQSLSLRLIRTKSLPSAEDPSVQLGWIT